MGGCASISLCAQSPNAKRENGIATVVDIWWMKRCGRAENSRSHSGFAIHRNNRPSQHHAEPHVAVAAAYVSAHTAAWAWIPVDRLGGRDATISASASLPDASGIHADVGAELSSRHQTA